MDGRLPQAAWEWFTAPVPPQGLGGLAALGQAYGLGPAPKPSNPFRSLLGAFDEKRKPK
jgi:hypothetical protein